jgi:hypothetical protein
VTDLPEERRALALAAVRNDGPRVYRGTEVQQTDAALSSRQVWTTVSMVGSRANPQVRFDLTAPDEQVRRALEDAFARWSKHEEGVGVENAPASLAEDVAGTDLLATHTTVFGPVVDEG